MRWLSLVALAALVACGGGGGATGTSAFGDGSGTTPLGDGAGTPPFGAGAGGGLAGDGPRPAADAPVVISTADVQGTVINAASGAALSGASVSFGGSTLTTTATGRYEQDTATAASREIFEASASNYETLYAPAEVLGTVPSVNLLRLTPYGTTTDITVGVGGTVTDTASSASVTLPANSLVGPGGAPAPATVGVRVTAIAAGNDPHLLSGDYTDDGGNTLESFGGAVVASSADVEVALGQSLALRIPISTRSASPPSPATLYRFEPATGLWIERGPVSISGGAYAASVDELGQWMVGAPIGNPISVSGCVVDDAIPPAPAPNVRMEVEGITYSGTAQVTTDSAGQFTFTDVVPSSRRVILSGRRGVFLTNSVAQDIALADVNVTTCLTLPSANAATMRLTWGANPRDVDSHLRTPDGAHVFYGSPGLLTAAPFASLDVDDVTGFGPEVTTIRRPKVGIYRFYLHNFSGTFSPGMTGSPVRLELNYAGRPVVFSPPSGEGSARWWHLFDLYIGSDCTMTLYRYNRWRIDEPQNPNASTTFTTATECVPS